MRRFRLRNDGEGEALIYLPLMTTRRSSKSSGAETSTFAVEIFIVKVVVVVAPHFSDAIASDL